MLLLTCAIECSRLRDSRVSGIEKAHSASSPLSESLEQVICAIKFGRYVCLTRAVIVSFTSNSASSIANREACILILFYLYCCSKH